MSLLRPHPNPSPTQAARNAFENAEAIFLDWDGCVMIGGQFVPAACSLLNNNSDRTVIVSNNSTHLPEDFTRILQSANITIPPERIILAGTEAIKIASQRRGAKTMIFSSKRLEGYAREMGITPVLEKPEQILLTRDTRFTYARLCRAINALHGGADLIVANGDVTHPGPDGQIVPETGALLATLKVCVPHASVTMVGKPGPLLFLRACEVAGVSPHQAIMIGDNPDTDGLGARNCGIVPILVGPGAQLELEDMRNW